MMQFELLHSADPMLTHGLYVTDMQQSFSSKQVQTALYTVFNPVCALWNFVLHDVKGDNFQSPTNKNMYCL
jgi:hypothetical protein